MSLAPHERRAMASIENALRRTDPALATMLATFTVSRVKDAGRRESPWRRAKTRIKTGIRTGVKTRVRTGVKGGVAAAFLLATLAALLIWGLLATAGHPPRCASRGHRSTSSGVVVTCAPVARSQHGKPVAEQP